MCTFLFSLFAGSIKDFYGVLKSIPWRWSYKIWIVWTLPEVMAYRWLAVVYVAKDKVFEFEIKCGLPEIILLKVACQNIFGVKVKVCSH